MDVAHKTIRDLPHFRVSAVAPNEANKDYFALFGEFDRTTDVVEGLCSLLMPHGDALNALSGYVQFHRPGEKTASVYVPTENSLEVLGLDLTYVHPRWNARHVWMISEPGWKWSRSKFCEADAVAKIVEGSQVSVVDGEEIRQWIQVSEKGNDSGLSRYYPIYPSGQSTLQIEADGIIKGGWTHSHCDICHAHIEAGTYGFLDPSDHWVCDKCHDRYVKPHDLSFMFE